MLVGMDSKASHAKGIPGITLTIALCLCAAFRAQMGGVQFVPLVECTRVHVPISLTFLLLYDAMFGQCAGPSAHTGDTAATPLSFSLFVIISIAIFLQNSNVSIAVSFFACARFCTAFTSATDKRKVNCRLGHHFIAQTSSKPVGS